MDQARRPGEELVAEEMIVSLTSGKKRNLKRRMKSGSHVPVATAFFAACLFLALFATGNLHAATEAVMVGDQKQLFIDDLFLKQPTNVSLRMHSATKTGERTLEPNQPWENASLNWFSVMQHDGKFRMWYECYNVEGWPTTNDTSFCYAESLDGIR